MNIEHKISGNELTVFLRGRVDATNASEAEEKIMSIVESAKGKSVLLDAEGLEYISSAGLRVVLKLRKAVKELTVFNVSAQVYEIFDMTGFTEMINIEKAYPVMSVEGCSFIAKGANGAVYRYDDETILKTYFAKDALPEIRMERENARKAFILGINTAIPYGIVRVGEGYGTVTELLNAVSVTKLIREDPHDLEAAADHYVGMLKCIHSVEAKEGEFADMKETALDWASFVSPRLTEERGKKLISLIASVPKRNNLLHGDYHTNNVMIQNGEPLLIDMDTLCMGHPIFELGSMYNAFKGYADLDHTVTERFFGFSYSVGVRFFDLAMKKYLGCDDEQLIRSVEEKAMVIGYTRMLRRAMRRPEEEDSPAKIEHCTKTLSELIDKIDCLDF